MASHDIVIVEVKVCICFKIEGENTKMDNEKSNQVNSSILLGFLMHVITCSDCSAYMICVEKICSFES